MREMARAAELVAEVERRKANIRRERHLLARAAADLADLQKILAGRGVRLVVKGEGEHPWPSRSSPSASSSPGS